MLRERGGQGDERRKRRLRRVHRRRGGGRGLVHRLGGRRRQRLRRDRRRQRRPHRALLQRRNRVERLRRRLYRRQHRCVRDHELRAPPLRHLPQDRCRRRRQRGPREHRSAHRGRDARRHEFHGVPRKREYAMGAGRRRDAPLFPVVPRRKRPDAARHHDDRPQRARRAARELRVAFRSNPGCARRRGDDYG